MFAAGMAALVNQPAAAQPAVMFQKERMSVKAVDVPLKDLLNEIEAKSQIAIEMKDEISAQRSISVEFSNLSPESAFEKILRGLNFAYFYSGTRLAQVLILSPGAGTFDGHVDKQAQPAGQFRSPSDRRVKRSLRPERETRVAKEAILDSRVQAQLKTIEALEDSEDPKSIAALGEALTDPSPEVKEAALAALTNKEGSLVTAMIRRGLNDRDSQFRIEVLEILAERKDIDSLSRTLSDSNTEVRERAAELLEESGR